MLQAVEPAKALRLIILDACRDNPFQRTMKRAVASRAIERGLATVEPTKPNTLIAFAAKGGSTADDGSGANSPFTTALLNHLTTPGLDLRKAFGLVRDDVMKATGNKQEPFVYDSLGGTEVSLVPAPTQQAVRSETRDDPQSYARRDYELAERIGTMEVWDTFLKQYPTGFYADFAKAQVRKLQAESARLSATEKAKQAEAEKVQQAAEAARIAAEKARQTEEAKAELTARARAAIEKAASDKLIKEKVEAESKAAEAAKKAAEKEQGEKTKLAALSVGTKDATTAPQDIARSLQSELRRVGCQTGEIGDDWSAAGRQSLALFNKHTSFKFDMKMASLDALDAVRSKTTRVCPLICEHGFRPDGENCNKIPCRSGFEVSDDNTCERIEPKKKLAPSAEQGGQRTPSTGYRDPSAGQKAASTTSNGCSYVACVEKSMKLGWDSSNAGGYCRYKMKCTN